MEVHAKKCVERYCELVNKTTQQLYKVSTPCIDDHHFEEEEELKSVGELSQVCSQIVLKCLYSARIGRADGQGDGVPKACREQAAADSRGSRTCVCANTLSSGVAHAGGEGRINVLPWYRLVGVAKNSSETQRRKSRAARKGKWPPRGTVTTVLTYPLPKPAVFRWQ